MTPTLLAVFLLACVTLSHRLADSAPLLPEQSLDVQTVEWPWISHGSSLLSLNAAFGAYLVAWLALGVGAVAGIAIGSICGLMLISHYLKPYRGISFEQYLLQASASFEPSAGAIFWRLVIVTQVLFAVAELIVFRAVTAEAFSMSPRGALVFCLSISLVGYVYTTVGGYGAVFRTDILQYGAILLMCLALFIVALGALLSSTAKPHLAIQGVAFKSWTFALPMPEALRQVLNMSIGSIIGMTFLLASPDAWKRVHATLAQDGNRQVGILRLVGAVSVPFALLTPIVAIIPRSLISSSSDLLELLPNAHVSTSVLLCVTLGVAAAFLSSFDSALLSATHLALVTLRPRGAYSLRSFHYLVGITYLLIAFLFLAAAWGVSNPYALGMLIAGSYAAIGGVMFATDGGIRRPYSSKILAWVLVVLLILWAHLALSLEHFLQRPHPSHLALAPYGAVIFIIAVVAAAPGSRNATR